jgi:diphthine synthase
MTFYLIGLGLDLKSLSLEALEAVKKCQKVYLEIYTVDYPYPSDKLEKVIGKRVESLGREKVENESIILEAKNKDVALLVYGNPLAATTHISLILKCKKEKVNYGVIHSESILTAIAETGLQLYKFGKTASMPKFQKNYEPDSFLDVVMDNLKVKAHTLLLTDIGLTLEEALEQLEKTAKKRNLKIEKIIVCSKVGTQKSKIYYGSISQLKKKKIDMPFCLIIPSELHFVEQEALEVLSEKA